jgi:hypothetical protein
MSSTSPTRWNPELIDELVSHGFDRDALVADDADTFTRHDNVRFRYISAAPIKAPSYVPSTDSRNGTRIKLYVREIKYPYAHISRRVAPLVILTTNPRWRKSLARWMITTTMLLTEEVWQKEDIEKAKEKRKEDQRNNKLSSLLDEFDITPAQWPFRINWDWQETHESPVNVASVLPFSINPKRHNWDGDTQVKKIGRLMLFLHQEKWINLDEIKEGRDQL